MSDADRAPRALGLAGRSGCHPGRSTRDRWRWTGPWRDVHPSGPDAEPNSGDYGDGDGGMLNARSCAPELSMRAHRVGVTVTTKPRPIVPRGARPAAGARSRSGRAGDQSPVSSARTFPVCVVATRSSRLGDDRDQHEDDDDRDGYSDPDDIGGRQDVTAPMVRMSAPARPPCVGVGCHRGRRTRAWRPLQLGDDRAGRQARSSSSAEGSATNRSPRPSPAASSAAIQPRSKPARLEWRHSVARPGRVFAARRTRRPCFQGFRESG